MLTTLSILSLDQGKLNSRPIGDEDYFARFREDAPVEQARCHWYDVAIAWPLLGKRRDREHI